MTIEQKRLEYIWILGHDYDGYNSAEDLKSLIDELVDVACGRLDEDVLAVFAYDTEK